MATIAKWIEEFAGDENIEAVVVGKHYSDHDWNDEPFNQVPIGVVMSWDEAKPFLTYEFDSGYNGADCHPVYVWTKTKIIMIHEYDGAVWPATVPRNPMDIVPEFGGSASWRRI